MVIPISKKRTPQATGMRPPSLASPRHLAEQERCDRLPHLGQIDLTPRARHYLTAGAPLNAVLDGTADHLRYC
jgi:hypothetical protein